MDTVTVRKQDLQEILRKNRKEHRAIFLEAQKKYRELVIKELDEQLQSARERGQFNVRKLVQIVAPEDHTRDYDVALQMLDMAVGRDISIDRADFIRYVRDEWEWSSRWAQSSSNYVSSKKFDPYLNQ
jgi:hypothetical protein